MNYVGRWGFHSVGSYNENGDLVYLNADEYIDSPMVYIDENDEEALAEELAERKKTTGMQIEVCADGTLYSGYTVDLQKRLQAHNAGKGAKYTRGRGPLELVYCEALPSHSDALKREIAIKRLTRAQKMDLIAKNKPAAG